MVTVEQLSENSRQGFAVQNAACIGLASELSGNLRWGCGHVYDETPVGIAVYVRNDPVNLIDPDGRQMRSTQYMPIWVNAPYLFYDEELEQTISGTIPVFLNLKSISNPTTELQERWEDLSESCKKGLKTAVGGSLASRLAALDRALAAQNTLESLTVGSVINWTMIAAIGIRETGFRNVAGKPYEDKNGVWHQNNGMGIFQIDLGMHPDVTVAQASDLVWSAAWVFNELKDNYSKLVPKSGDFNSDQFLQALAASHNIGPGGISGNPDTIDVGTWNGNYGSNILDLMDCFK
jgi:hypothetical protein